MHDAVRVPRFGSRLVVYDVNEGMVGLKFKLSRITSI
jgi:hypothetical protein